MTEPVVRVEGVAELRKAMRRAGDDLADFKDANAQAADVAADAARAHAPRLTGALAATVRPGATKTQAIVRAGTARVPYAGVITYGWPARGIEPQPQIVDAVHDSEPRWIAVYRTAIDKIINRIRSTP